MSISLPNVDRNHRTALVIDATGPATEEFQNRVSRLLESVNGENIKVDVYTLTGQASGGGSLSLVPGSPEFEDDDEDEDFSPASSVTTWAKSQGYSLVLTATGLK